MPRNRQSTRADTGFIAGGVSRRQDMEGAPEISAPEESQETMESSRTPSFNQGSQKPDGHRGARRWQAQGASPLDAFPMLNNHILNGPIANGQFLSNDITTNYWHSPSPPLQYSEPPSINVDFANMGFLKNDLPKVWNSKKSSNSTQTVSEDPYLAQRPSANIQFLQALHGPSAPLDPPTQSSSGGSNTSRYDSTHIHAQRQYHGQNTSFLHALHQKPAPTPPQAPSLPSRAASPIPPTQNSSQGFETSRYTSTTIHSSRQHYAQDDSLFQALPNEWAMNASPQNNMFLHSLQQRPSETRPSREHPKAMHTAMVQQEQQNAMLLHSLDRDASPAPNPGQKHEENQWQSKRPRSKTMEELVYEFGHLASNSWAANVAFLNRLTFEGGGSADDKDFFNLPPESAEPDDRGTSPASSPGQRREGSKWHSKRPRTNIYNTQAANTEFLSSLTGEGVGSISDKDPSKPSENAEPGQGSKWQTKRQIINTQAANTGFLSGLAVEGIGSTGDKHPSKLSENAGVDVKLPNDPKRSKSPPKQYQVERKKYTKDVRDEPQPRVANVEFLARDHNLSRHRQPSRSFEIVAEIGGTKHKPSPTSPASSERPSKAYIIEHLADASHLGSDIPSDFANREFLVRDRPAVDLSLQNHRPAIRYPQQNAHANSEFLVENRPNTAPAPPQQYQVNNSYPSVVTSLDTIACPEFSYSPLHKERPGSIRLIKFDPNGPKLDHPHELHYEMVPVDTTRGKIEYICLSYCWGDGGRAQSIQIKEEHEPEACYRSLYITENLLCALECLQASSTYSDKLMWIDMISINQKDLGERASQVAIMKSIYDSAAGVVVWLGESHAARAALPTINRIYTSFLADTGFKSGSIIGSEGLRLSQEHLDLLKTYTTVYLLRHTPIEAYELLEYFFSLPWFRRVWVLQEASLHRTVTAQVGNDTIPFDSIIVAALWQSFLTRSYTSISDALLNRTRSGQGYLPELWLNLLHTRTPRGLSIMELVCRARDFQATDPRDKIYAMLGLANDVTTSSGSLFSFLQPDYTRPKEAVYLQFAKGIIETSGNLDILSAVDTFSSIRDEEKIDLKASWNSISWIPDLDIPVATIRGLGFPRKFNAAFDTTATHDWTYASTSNTLSLSGFVIDTVGPTVSPLLTLSPGLRVQMDDHFHAVSALWSEHFSGSASFVPAERLHKIQNFVHTLTATGFAVPNSFPEYPLGQVHPPQAVPSIIFDFAAYWARTDPDFSLLGLYDPTSFQEHAKVGDADQFAVLAGKACHERKFFFTTQKRMGLCPRNARPGDKIVVLYGGSVPYVLRQRPHGNWAFVGECYVDGIMFGEAQDIKKRLKIEDRIFHIR